MEICKSRLHKDDAVHRFFKLSLRRKEKKGKVGNPCQVLHLLPVEESGLSEVEEKFQDGFA
jgi:hypothetical protein